VIETDTISASEIIAIDEIKVQAYTIPTELPESDGTIEWNSTTLVLVRIFAGGKTGIGYTYSNPAAAVVIHSFSKILKGKNCLHISEITESLIRFIRNDGQCGIAMTAVSAVDIALWDLKAKILEIPLCVLLGQNQSSMLIYGSGGFTSYSTTQTSRQFLKWAEYGISHFKMKVGRDEARDPERVRSARKTIGSNAGLFVDANGAYTARKAIEMAGYFNEEAVIWFEEPVIASDFGGMLFVKMHVPVKCRIASGEYGYELSYFKKMIGMGSVDVVQADATRCGGISNFLKAGFISEAYNLPFSSHCAPSVHLHAALHLPAFEIAEYFHDHARIENMLFDGVIHPVDGFLKPDLSRSGLGIEFRFSDATRYKI
jgi:L-alanine-DL-glutamate epimerase-like enolase superfamily enzyme